MVPSISAFEILFLLAMKNSFISLFSINANSSLSKYRFISFLMLSFSFVFGTLGPTLYNLLTRLLYSLYSSLNLKILFIFSQSGILYSLIKLIQKVLFKYIAKISSLSENAIISSISFIILQHSFSILTAFSNPFVSS